MMLRPLAEVYTPGDGKRGRSYDGTMDRQINDPTVNGAFRPSRTRAARGSHKTLIWHMNIAFPAGASIQRISMRCACRIQGSPNDYELEGWETRRLALNRQEKI